MSASRSAQLRLLHVHAHPDDESSKGAATTAKYVAEGIDVMVATCTGGERGSVLNPKLAGDPEVELNIAAIRAEEMRRAREILGIRQVWLGFVDSGYREGDPFADLPEGCFGREDVAAAAGRLVRVIREFRPHVVTTYDEQGGYPHPDHIRTHELSMFAWRAAADARQYPQQAEQLQGVGGLHAAVGGQLRAGAQVDVCVSKLDVSVHAHHADSHCQRPAVQLIQLAPQHVCRLDVEQGLGG